MSNLDHYAPLYLAYAVAMLLMVLAIATLRLWPPPAAVATKRPWRELGLILLAAVAVVAIGTALHHRGPDTTELAAPLRIAVGTLLEIVRFSPLLVLLIWRRSSPASLWIPRTRLLRRLAIGAGIALVAFCTYAAATQQLPWSLAERIQEGLTSRDLLPVPLAVHILFEDIMIAVLGAGLLAIARRAWIAALAVALLFALGHLSPLVSQGLRPAELVSMLLDAGLGVGIVLLLARTRDIVWFWPLHLVMDLTQFGARP